jgi:DNA-binding MarR family transcriptional regulator/GNAT superfamily N-acetyltransferase
MGLTPRTATVDPSLVERVRHFNRLVTERVGALDDHFMGRARPLGESRLLWEVGEGNTEVRELRTRLSLDSGYVSRMLRSLEAQGLVEVEDSARDARVRSVRLTEAGREERAVLNHRSDDFARSVLEPLSDRQRTRLVEAMAAVERLLLASMVTIAPEDPASADATWCLEQYFAEIRERFEGGFDRARCRPLESADMVPPAGLLLVARLRGEPVGCGALRLYGRGPAEIKRMWVARSARGLGLGRRLLCELENRAWLAGARVVHLDTNRELTEAIALYRQAGYREVPPFNDEVHAHHWFEKQLRTAEAASASRGSRRSRAAGGPGRETPPRPPASQGRGRSRAGRGGPRAAGRRS